jgi:hypothetical protein
MKELSKIIQEVVATQNKQQVIQGVIETLNRLTFPVDDKTLQDLTNRLQSIGIKPVDILASMGKQHDPNIQKQYLLTGPSAPGGGGHGALNDLSNIIRKQ